jgi:hypothetical protein
MLKQTKEGNKAMAEGQKIKVERCAQLEGNKDNKTKTN